ncbi:glycerate kinase [Dolosigranulum pigrum]|jgi:glycerate kinase|uniref:glycerate kinase n=1 Tax=Dolosigranulum pigrum TaxID=29394 RepID=UPI001AD852C5|nr:glycerate kinase [Dolosigranulum pigrum]QTJ45504.1 glycerate kinase [Dolosigranulum pigrum]
MKIVIAPDSFKESMTALEAANAIERGFRKVFTQADYKKIPMADGGEGTVESVIDATDGRLRRIQVHGPLGEEIYASYGISGDGKLAIIEMAASSGLQLTVEKNRNPMKTSTIGFGELINDALDQGVDELLLGIGGSATNDAGAGMISSLGGKLLNKNGKEIHPTGEGLAELSKIDLSGLHPRLKDVDIRVACDVDNPLCGPQGASYIYGQQKGGTPEQIEQLDQNLARFAQVLKNQFGRDVMHIPGAGAAGGLGASLVGLLGASLERGGDLIVDILDLKEKIQGADLVITGEGGINHQTVYGKTPIAVSMVAKQYNVPTIAIAGCLKDDYDVIFDKGISAVFSIIQELNPLEVILNNGEVNLEKVAENIAQVLKVGKRIK